MLPKVNPEKLRLKDVHSAIRTRSLILSGGRDKAINRTILQSSDSFQSGAAIIEYNVLRHLKASITPDESLRVSLYIVHKGTFWFRQVF